MPVIHETIPQSMPQSVVSTPQVTTIPAEEVDEPRQEQAMPDAQLDDTQLDEQEEEPPQEQEQEP